MKVAEEAVSASSKSLCETCAKPLEPQKDLESHEQKMHDDENMPSSSKCGKCDYESEDDSDLNTHMKSDHGIRCDLCSYVEENELDLEGHNLFEHNFPCPNCLNIFRTPDKLDRHICKLQVLNPTFESFYSKDWLDGNGCNSIFCSELGREVLVLHCSKCVNKIKTCCWIPYSVSVKVDGIMHIESRNFTYERKMRHREILWPKVLEAIKQN